MMLTKRSCCREETFSIKKKKNTKILNQFTGVQPDGEKNEKKKS